MNPKKIILILCLFNFEYCFPQFKTIVQGGGNKFVEDISIVGNNVIINCSNHSIIMCNDNCDSTWALNLPGPLSENYYKLFRNDRDTVFASTNNFSNNSGNLYKSIDAGNSWENIFSITGNYFYGLAVTKNKNIAIGSDGGRFFFTSNLFLDWTYNDIAANNFAFIVAGSIGDSTFYLFNDGYLLKTNNLFQTWSYGNFGNYNPNGLHILNKDTLMICATGSNNYPPMVSFSVNGGITWQNKNFAYGNFINDVYFKSANEGYAVGRNALKAKGTIYKTIDFGQTWEEVYYPAYVTFSKIEFINDSIALLGASNGLLVQWNTKIPITTSLEKIESQTSNFIVYPNPAINTINIQTTEEFQTVKQIIIQNSIGEITKVFENVTPLSYQINLDIYSLQTGLYFIKIIDKNGTINTLKFIKQN